MSLEECRARLPISRLWGVLGLGGADKVERCEPGGREAKIRSPWREDRNPSFSVWIDRDGVGCWKDHGTGDHGDEVTAIERARGLSTKDAIAAYHELAGVEMKRKGGKKRAKAPRKQARPAAVEKRPAEKEEEAEAPAPKAPPRSLGEPVAVYDYTDERGRLAHQTLRFHPKAFRQRRPGGAGEPEWVWTLRDAPVFPYRLPRLVAAERAQPVFLVEGEKDVENLERLGDEVVATTLPMGAGKWRPEYARWFRGRWVVVIADDDQPGEDGAQKVARELVEVADAVGVVRIRDLWKAAPDGSDVSDWLESGWAAEVTVDDLLARLLEVAAAARGPEVDFKECAAINGRGEETVVEDRLARLMVRGRDLIYCGDSFWRWHRGRGLWERVRERTWINRQVRHAMRVADRERCITANKVASVVKLAQSERVCFPEDLNGHPPGCLAVRNGLLDVERGRLFPHFRGHLTTVQVPHVYDPAAECPEWERWLGDRQPDEATRAQLQEMFGYCLFTHINFHSFFFLFGEGGTGKSTCVDVLEWLVGEENKVAVELTELDNAFTRSQLVGKTLYLAKELTTQSFRHIGIIKAIVSGDPIYVDVKYGQGFDFRPSGRLVMESNVVAATPDSSGGFERRFIQINFDNPIDRRRMAYGFQERFRLEMSGILNWAIAGYKRLAERGRFEHTERSQKATEELMRHRAQVASFLADGWLEDTGRLEDRVRMDRVLELYAEWADVWDVVVFFDRKDKFSRELFNRRPDWRGRKARQLFNGVRDTVIRGVRETAKGAEAPGMYREEDGF